METNRILKYGGKALLTILLIVLAYFIFAFGSLFALS